MDELRTGLELATTEELQGMATILFSRRFNPLDYLTKVSPESLPLDNRQTWLEQLERRFRFLAADGMTVLRQRSHQTSYRTILMRVCQYLDISCLDTSSALILEESIFLYLLDMAYQKLPPSEQQALERYFQRTLSRLPLGQSFPPSSETNALHLLLKGSSALMVSSVIRPLVLKRVAGQIALHMARYQVAQQALASGGAIAGAVQQRVILQMARRGVALNFARYSAVRGVFSVLGPALWTWFLADLGWRAIATRYSRIIPVIFIIAQIRLLRNDL